MGLERIWLQCAGPTDLHIAESHGACRIEFLVAKQNARAALKLQTLKLQNRELVKSPPPPLTNTHRYLQALVGRGLVPRIDKLLVIEFNDIALDLIKLPWIHFLIIIIIEVK